jgi:toxin YoeB
MSLVVKFDTEAWNDYLNWQNQDKKTLRKINSLIKDVAAFDSQLARRYTVAVK